MTKKKQKKSSSVDAPEGRETPQKESAGSAEKGVIKKTLFGILFFILIVVSAELLLGLFHFERYDHLFLQQGEYPFFIPGKGEFEGNYVTNPHFLSQLNPVSFSLFKKKGVRRVFILGGSAAHGFPYGNVYGFSGYLQRAFDHFAPGKFEIINAAGMSFGSHRVLDELRDIVSYEPDLVIIFSGNNEYVERNILPSSYGRKSSIQTLRDVLGELQIYRAMRLGLYRINPKIFQRPIARDMTDIRSGIVVRRAGMKRSLSTENEVVNNYRHNIEAMRDILAKHGITAIFCTVPSNIAEWVPESRPPFFKQKQDKIRWEELQKRVYVLFEEGRTGKSDVFLELERLLNELIVIDPENAWLYYNLGQVEMALGKYDAGYESFREGKDLDSKPIRALSSFNNVIRDIAGIGKGVFIADLEQAVAEVIRSGFTGGMFLDYCHFTLNGHKFLAEKILPVINQALGSKLPVEEIGKSIDSDDISPEGNLHLVSIEQYVLGMTAVNNEMPEDAIKAFSRALELTPADDRVFRAGLLDNMGGAYFAMGMKDKGRKLYFMALQEDPNDTAALLQVGRFYLDDGRFEEAGDLFKRLLKVNAYSPEAYEGLGKINLQKGDNRGAINHFEKALKLGAGNGDIFKQMAIAYFTLGEKEKAMDALQKARGYDPFDKEIDEIQARFRSLDSNRSSGVVR